MQPNENEVRGFILDHLAQAARDKGLNLPPIDDATNLLDLGVLDSLGFIELLLRLQDRFGIALQLADLDPAEFSTFKGMLAVACRVA